MTSTNMPSGTRWGTASEQTSQGRSLFGSIRKLGSKKNDSSSTRSNTSRPENTPSSRGAADMGTQNPFPPTSPETRRPDRPGMNAFTVPSNEPPPAYSPNPIPGAQPVPMPMPYAPAELPAQLPVGAGPGGEDPYSFLSTFDTVILIDDSGSMAGRGWREVSQALATIAPVVTSHDADGIDVYFLNHKSGDRGAPTEGIAPTGYRGIKRAETISEIFERVRPYGGTPTGTRVHHILKPYIAKLERDMAEGKDCKPLNLIVLTDGVPSDDVESVIISIAKKLDKLDAPPFQVGVQFFQVGNEAGAKEALEELDDELSNMVEGGIRDMVDTVTWTGGISQREGGVGLTGDGILKAVLGAVVKRLDRRRASGDAGRSRRG